MDSMSRTRSRPGLDVREHGCEAVVHAENRSPPYAAWFIVEPVNHVAPGAADTSESRAVNVSHMRFAADANL